MTAIGDIIHGRYRLVSVIGRGGMSTVYLAIDTKLGMQWTVKEILDSTDAVAQEVIRHSLLTEMEMLKELDHPSIPRIVDVFEDRGSLFVVRDYVDGSSLSSLLSKKQSFSEQEVVDWGIQLCDVLDYMHRQDPPVVYRDMKPSNVMITRDGFVRLIDFGIACKVDDRTKRVVVGDERSLGTPGYAAPEQLGPNPVINPQNDVYGLGATLYVLLTGVNPRKEGIRSIRERHPEISVGLDNIIHAATQRDPRKRFADCALFAYALRHFKEQDSHYVRGLKAKRAVFVGVVVAAVMSFVVSGGFQIAARVARNNDFDHWMTVASVAPDQKTEEKSYLKAARIQPSSTQPYENLIATYSSNTVFTPREEKLLVGAITENSSALQQSLVAWAKLSYDLGKLYWYYYQPAAIASLPADQRAKAMEKADTQRERIILAGHWMQKAAAVEPFEDRDSASIYADIASFSSTITPLIDQGEDVHVYKPYFQLLQRLVFTSRKDVGKVTKLESANLVAHALITYGRDFRANGVGKGEMKTLLVEAETLARSVSTSNKDLVERQKAVISNLGRARQGVTDAFIDVNGHQGQDQ
ncbi:MAG: serine/threonine protein kinase [Parascardovia denticolens]